MTHSDPFRISIVIASYNMAATLPRAIRSAANQTLLPLEILIVDDGSTDETQNVLQTLQSEIPMMRVIRQENLGTAVAKNTGVRQAQGNWIGFLDADDAWMPNRLKIQTELLLRDPNCYWSAGAYQRIQIVNGQEKEHGDLRLGSEILQSEEDFFDALSLMAGSTSIWIGTVLAKKTALEEQGLFDEQLYGSDDRFCSIQLALHCPRIAFIRQPIAKYTVAQAGSVTSVAARQIEPSRFTFFEKLNANLQAITDETKRAQYSVILQKEISAYVKALTRSGNPAAARQVIQWAQANRMPKIPWKHRLAAQLPATSIKASRAIWLFIRGSLR